MNKKGIIYGINGPVIYLKGNTGLRMSEMVHVGEEHLVGEVISLSKKATTVQVFEETTGLKPGAEVVGTGDAIGSVTLAPGILNNIFDGIERPLKCKCCPLRQIYHPWCQRRFSGYLQKMECSCDSIRGRSCIAEIPLSRKPRRPSAIVHQSMVPPDVEGTVISST